jgi:hypothetical protein
MLLRSAACAANAALAKARAWTRHGPETRSGPAGPERGLSGSVKRPGLARKRGGRGVRAWTARAQSDCANSESISQPVPVVVLRPAAAQACGPQSPSRCLVRVGAESESAQSRTCRWVSGPAGIATRTSMAGPRVPSES